MLVTTLRPQSDDDGIINSADLPSKSDRRDRLRLIFHPGQFAIITASEDVVCGEYSVIASGLTAAELSLLEFLLSFPFRVDHWNIDSSEDGILSRQAAANLYHKIFSGEF